MDTDSLSASYNPRPGKFIVPSRLPDLLRRQRLLDFLHENIHRKLILIAAAAGYGKSSLLMDFAHDTDYPVAWYQLDDADSDLAALALGLVSALKRLYPNFQSVLPSLAARPGANPDDLANAFNREIETTIDEYCVIVLDDFHLIEHSSQIIRFFDVLLAGLPEQAHFIISGRTLPPIRVVSLAARQQVAGLNEERLRFTVDEVKALVEARSKAPLADADAESLVSNTEGWITGILLSAQLMSQGSMSGMLPTRSGDSPVYDFLADEVLDRQPELLKRFLVESAVLPEMEPSVCDSVLGRADSDALLREAEARHLFVNAVGDEFRSYHYHHLFREFLLSRLRAQAPVRLQALQVKAAEWYAVNDMPEAAVTFYLLAGQTTEAAAIAERTAKAMFLSGRFATLQRWAEQLSSAAHDVPRVHLYMAKMQRDVDRLAAELTLDLATQGFVRRDDKVGRLDVDLTRAWWAYIDGEIATARSLAESCLAVSRELGTVVSESIALRYLGLCSTALGKFVEAESYLQEAVNLLDGTSHRFDLATTLDDLANILRLRGQTARSAQTQQLALAAWRQLGAPGPLAMALNNAGFDLYLLGQYESALAIYQEALQWTQKAGNTRIEALIQAGQGDVFADLGDEVLAADLYRQAMAKAEKAGDKGLLAYLYRAMARLNRAAGNFAAALEWLRRADLISGKLPSPLTNTEGLRGIILTEMGRMAEGRRVLEQACAGMARTSGMVDHAQTLFFCACSQFRDGDLEAAIASFSQALSIAEQIGYDLMLVVEALSGADMLDAFASRQDIGLQARSLLMRARNLGIIRERLAGSSAVSVPAQHAALEVRALGQSCVFKDGVEVSQTTWGSQRPRELFFFLVDRAPIARDVVLNTFWPEKPAAKAVNNLYQAMFRIRRALGYDVVTLEQGECRLSSVVAFTYDARRFEAEAQQALALRLGDLRRLELLESAAALYIGEYLADLSVEWAAERRRSLCDLYVLVLREYADILMNLTRYNEARQALARALDVEPLRDDIHEKMLNCLAAMGRRHEVVDHYRRYRDTLRSELGIDPPTEMRALYGRLLG